MPSTVEKKLIFSKCLNFCGKTLDIIKSEEVNEATPASSLYSIYELHSTQAIYQCSSKSICLILSYFLKEIISHINEENV